MLYLIAGAGWLALVTIVVSLFNYLNKKDIADANLHDDDLD